MRLAAVFCFATLAASEISCFVPPRRGGEATTEPRRGGGDHNRPTEVRPVGGSSSNPFSIFARAAPRVPAPASHSKLSDDMFRIEPHLMIAGPRRRRRKHGQAARAAPAAGRRVKRMEARNATADAPAPPPPRRRYRRGPRVIESDADPEAEAFLRHVVLSLRSLSRQLVVGGPPQQRRWKRTAALHSHRQYDVPQVECPPARDGTEQFSCPSKDHVGRYRCIDDRGLCDGFIDCPNGEDEDLKACMFYKTTKAHLDVLADALLRWARGRY